MNKTTCGNPVKTVFEDKILPSLYLLVFVVGMILNLWGMKSLLQNWNKIRSINILVLNLGLADMFYLLTLPFLIVYYLKGSEWIFEEGFCKVTRFCFNLNLYGSIGFLTCLSVFRYLAVVHPLKAMGRLTITHSVIISIVVWILVSAQALPDMFYPKSNYNKKQCFETTNDTHIRNYLDYNISRTLTGFCLPFIIIVVCYGHVTLVVCRSKMMKKDVKGRFLKLMVLLMVLFSTCYAPYHIFKNLNQYSRVLKTQKKCPAWDSGVFIAHQVSRGLVSLNSALNPLVYLHVNDDMSAQLRQLLQGGRQIFGCLSKSDSVAVPQTDPEPDSAL